MLFEPNPTPYDLNLELFGTRVRVHPMFFLFSAILGWGILDNHPLIYLVVWVMLVFLSVLLHEFGHVWMGRLFGSDGYIVMYSFGGLAVGSNRVSSRWQRILVSLAGPLIQLALYGAIRYGLPLLGRQRLADMPDMFWFIVEELLVINLFWPLLNLLPIWPLDGGQVARELFSSVAPREGVKYSLILSMGLAGLMAVNSLAASNGKPLIDFLPTGGMYMTLLFASLAFESYQLYQQRQHFYSEW